MSFVPADWAILGHRVRVRISGECPSAVHDRTESGSVGTVRWVMDKMSHPFFVEADGADYCDNFAAYELEAFDPIAQEIIDRYRKMTALDESRMVRIERPAPRQW